MKQVNIDMAPAVNEFIEYCKSPEVDQLVQSWIETHLLPALQIAEKDWTAEE